MINITKGNDFKLKATFTRGGEDFAFDSVSTVNFFPNIDTKYGQKFEYADGVLTIKGANDLPQGTYGVEVIGKEGDAQRRTAFTKVFQVTNTTTAGTYEPESDIDSYDIGMKVELDMSVEKKNTEATGTETKTYKKTTDTSVQEGKTYYTDENGTVATETDGKNPSEQGWYEEA